MFIVAPAWGSYGRLWERIAASFLSIYIGATLLGIGIARGRRRVRAVRAVRRPSDARDAAASAARATRSRRGFGSTIGPMTAAAQRG